MPEFEIRIRLADAPPGYAEHVTWAVGRALDAYPHLSITLEPPRQVNPPGSTVEQLPPEVLAVVVGADGTHRYVSTYCVHGDCGACRRTCKTCEAVCLHECHQEASR